MLHYRQPRKREAETLYQFRIDVPVSSGGLSEHLNEMIEWCGTNVETGQWALHGHVKRTYGKVSRDYSRFYFMTETDADLFWWRWCVPQ
jgi:hypothetical protein